MTEPIACRVNALTPEERLRQQALRRELDGAILERRETPAGYQFVYRDSPQLLGRIAEWIAIERRCCPFVDFTLSWRAEDEHPTLELGGRAEVKAFIAQTFL